MSRPKEKIIVLNPIGSNGFDIGNTANAVAEFLIPCKLSILRAQYFSNTAQASNSTAVIGVGNANSSVASLTILASAAAGQIAVKTMDPPSTVNAGTLYTVSVTESGDSGEKGFVQLLCEYEPEVIGNQSGLTETA